MNRKDALDLSSRAFSLVRSLSAQPTRVALLLSTFLLAFLLSGCTQRTNTPADFVIINGAEPESLDPAICTGQPDGRVAGALFDGLTRVHPQTAEAIPSIAERWEISPDGKTYTFFLRTNAQWSTGEPITAEDVVYSWRRVVNPATAADYAGQLFYVKNGEAIATGKIKDLTQLGVRALSPYVLQVELNNPTPFFLDLCAFRTLAVVPRQTIEKYGDQWIKAQPLPTSGNYTLESWRVNDRIRLRKNPRHWDVAHVQNELIDLIHLDSATAAVNLFLSGAADVIWDKGLVPSELIDALRKEKFTHTYTYLATYFVRFNVTRPPFNDPRVRKALALSVDKKRITQYITKGGEPPASTLVPPGTSHYTSPQGLDYNPEEARRLLAEAGFPKGEKFPSFSYLANTSRLNEQIAVELQEMWRKELGIRMEIRQTEWKVYLADQSAVNFDLSRSSWVGDYNDPNTFLDMFTSNNGNNRTGWKNTQYDTLIEKANGQVDLKARAATLAEAEQLLVNDQIPIIPLYFYVGITLYHPDQLSGIGFNVIDEHPLYPIRRMKRNP